MPKPMLSGSLTDISCYAIQNMMSGPAPHRIWGWRVWGIGAQSGIHYLIKEGSGISWAEASEAAAVAWKEVFGGV